jgi:hypothetical protein
MPFWIPVKKYIMSWTKSYNPNVVWSGLTAILGAGTGFKCLLDLKDGPYNIYIGYAPTNYIPL